ncbi:MAG: hypothetical protein RL331_1151 [Bacteroidota bacterium]|jgi:hypothetical protein
MFNKTGIVCCFLSLSICIFAQQKPNLQNSLDSILKLDQDARNQIDRVLKDMEFQDSILSVVGLTMTEFLQQSMEKQAIQDEQNLAWIKVLIQTYGYPGKTIVGEKHAEVAWLVLQHSSLDDLKMFLPLIKEAYQHGEIDPICYAKSKDRVLIGDRKPQLFGTQLYFNIESQSYAIYQIKNKKKLNKRRCKLGLDSIESYLYKNFELEYKQLVEVKP